MMCICALTRLAAVVNVSRAFREEVRFESAAAHCRHAHTPSLGGDGDGGGDGGGDGPGHDGVMARW